MTTRTPTHGSGSGTMPTYKVEARLNYIEPKEYRGMILDKEWRQVQFPSGPIGIPNSLRVLHPDAAAHGLLDFDCALALAHWFMVSETLCGGLCVETRLVKITYKYEFSTEEVGVGPVMNMTESMRSTKFEEREKPQ